MNLKGKVAIVIGGTSGIGAATAVKFAQEGARVLVCGRNQEAGKEVVGKITENKGTAKYVKVDTTAFEDVQQAVQEAKDTYGTVDILYNGAGIHDAYKTALDMEEEDFDQLMDVNVKGPFLAVKAVLPVFLDKGKGTVINVGSQASSVAGPGGSAYVTSKHALVGFTRQLAYDFGSKGVKANLLAPGFVETPMTEGIEEERLKDIPARRAGKPEEIAALAVFLASDDSDYMHGTTVTADGGWIVGR